MSQETMPITDEVKKKHKLFPFNIIRKRRNSKSANKDAKGRSKSLLDLYGGGDKGSLESNHNSMRRKKMSETVPIHVNSSFESNEFDIEREFDRTSEGHGAAQSHSGEDSQFELGDEVDFHDDSEPSEPEGKVVDFDTAELKPKEKERWEDEGQNEEGDPTVEFPQGTTVSLSQH